MSGRTWLLVAAEQREFDGIVERIDEIERTGDRFVMVAGGPGRQAIERVLEKKMDVDGVISTGFCGALDPALRVGDIVRSVVTIDRVAVTAAEKRELREKTCAVAVDMESAAVAKKAEEWGVPFYCIRAVSDTAEGDLPLDFNLYRDAQGRFSRWRIALAALGRPFTAIPALLRLERDCRIASESLGEFFAHCRL